MDIILLQDVDHVGYKHEMVTVKDGYGRNFLIPQGMALIANKTNLNANFLTFQFFNRTDTGSSNHHVITIAVVVDQDRDVFRAGRTRYQCITVGH